MWHQPAMVVVRVTPIFHASHDQHLHGPGDATGGYDPFCRSRNFCSEPGRPSRYYIWAVRVCSQRGLLNEKGKVTAPVKGATLIGRQSHDAISMIGDDLTRSGIGCAVKWPERSVGVGQPVSRSTSDGWRNGLMGDRLMSARYRLRASPLSLFSARAFLAARINWFSRCASVEIR